MSPTIDLDMTLAMLQRDFKSIPTDEALTMIDAWYSLFENTALGEGLRQVREIIENGSGTGISLSDLLIDLGTNTLESSNEAGDDETTAAKIQDISTLLNEAGNALK